MLLSTNDTLENMSDQSLCFLLNVLTSISFGLCKKEKTIWIELAYHVLKMSSYYLFCLFSCRGYLGGLLKE
jgi:hypothetical protein